MSTSKLALAGLAASALLMFFIVPAHDASAGGVSVVIHGEIVVAPAPPPVVITPLPPPPPYVVVQATPVYMAPAVYVQPVPYVMVKPQPAAQILPPGPPPFYKKVGIGLKLDGGIHGSENKNGSGMGGAGIFLRMRLKPHFGLELGVDALAGKGYGGEERLEVPVTFGMLFYPNRHWAVAQPYFALGIGGAWARVGEDPHADRPTYLGGYAGLGLELRLGNHFGLFGDIRGFIRHRMNDRPDDVLVPSDGSCKENGKCTDWEGGGLFTLGFVVYF